MKNNKSIIIALSIVFILTISSISILWYMSGDLHKRSATPVVSDLQVTNLTSNSGAVTFFTDIPASIPIRLITDSGEVLQERYDDRDYSLNNEGEETSNETKNKIQSHHVTFTGLKAGTTYRLNFPSTVSLSSVVESDVSVSTFSKENEPSQPNPIYGKLVDNADKSIKDAIVFISLSNSQSEQKSLWGSTIPNDNGGWTFDLNLLTNEEGEVAIVGKGDTEIIRVASYNSKINNEYYKVKPDEDQPVGNLIVDNTKLESESNESFLPFVKTLERSSVLGAQSCSCDCNGTSDKYCGKLGTDQQTI
ncbi:fibronectin type III domain-containing protein, partial [Candidatus Dojkabacteria bacterium]|nr:fibronectin type III domain-containing protein [Candidatus Dojkabacteria bacterium]